MKEFRVSISDSEKYEFYRRLQEHFSKYYRYPYYSDGYISVNGKTTQNPQGNICYLENRRKTFLRIEEFYDYILIQVVLNSKRTLTVLRKFLKNSGRL